MARWKVTRVERGPRRSITGLYGPAFDYRSVREVIEDIETGTHAYYVRAGSHETTITVVVEQGRKQITTTLDVLSRNNLLNLPRI